MKDVPVRVVACLAITGLAACGGSPSMPSTVTAVATTPTPPPARALTVNDISILFPLGRGDLWTASMPGRDALPLLPRSAMDLPGRAVIRELQGGDATYAGIRVVSLRFDPCFGDPCHPQIRLVFQALNAAGTSAFDGAFHALYNLTPDEFAAVTVRLRALGAQAPENAPVTRLEVSPALLAQGMSGAYATGLRDLVAQYASGSNLAKFTFMTRNQGGGDRWDFGGVNLRDFEPRGGFDIPTLGATLQTVRESGGRGSVYAYTVTPGILRGELARVLSSADAQNATAGERQLGVDALARAENPAISSPDTIDCAGCHLANRIRGHLQTTFNTNSALSFVSASEIRRLVGGSETDPDNLRAFGYFNANPAIAQRTANETIKVLAAMR